MRTDNDVLSVECPECGSSIGVKCTQHGVPVAVGDSHSIRFTVDTVTVSVSDAVNHPAHYGGEDNPYEAIKVIEAWQMGFNLGNVIKYLSRADLKGAPIEDLEKASWYLSREIQNRRKLSL